MLSHFSNVQHWMTPWTVAHQAHLSMRFPRQVGCYAVLQGNLPDPGIKPTSLCLLHWQVGSLPRVPPGKPLKAMVAITKETINIKIKFFF